MLNKVALVTLWVEPNSHQIVKYTFDNVDFGFLPAQWLVRVNDVKASMTLRADVAAKKTTFRGKDRQGADYAACGRRQADFERGGRRLDA